MRTPLAWFVFLVALVIARGEALAQPADLSVTLEWTAPAACPSHDQVLVQVGAFLRGSSATPVGIKARASVSRRASGWHMEMAIQTPDGGGTRSFEADSCESIASTAAFMLALAVDPTHPPTVVERPLPTPTPDLPATPSGLAAPEDHVPSPPAAALPTPAATPAASSTGSAPAAESATAHSLQRRPAFPFPLVVGASAIVDDGSLPSPAFGGELTLAWRPPPWRFEVYASMLSPQSVAVTGLPGASTRFSLLGGGARGCLAASAWRLELGPCLGAEVDRVSADGNGVATTLHGSATAFEAVIVALGTLSLPPFAIRLGAEGVIPFARPDYVVLQASTQPAFFVHRAASVEERTMLGVELRFP
jgi:hypothetical protein